MSLFRNKGVYKMAIGFAMGGLVGWVAGGEKNKNHNLTTDPRSGLQTVLASWTNSYKPSVWDENWDRRDPKFLENSKNTETKVNPRENNKSSDEESVKPKPKAIRHLFLIRHGQYNLSGEDDGKHYLTDLGSAQADLTGKRLSELGHPYNIVIHSNLTRARQTANIIHKHLETVPMIECSMIQEGAPFPPEPPLKRWKPDYKQFYEDGSRIEAAFRKYFHRASPSQTENSYEVFVCHANVIRYFACRALQLPPEAWLRISLHHGSITWISIHPNGRVALRSLGDCGHAPREKLTVT